MVRVRAALMCMYLSVTHVRTSNVLEYVRVRVRVWDRSRCPLPGHAWQSIVHKDDTTWLAYYKDTINGEFK